MNHWYIKIAETLGLIALVWKLINGGVPRLFAWLLPIVVALTHRAMAWLLSKPVVHEAIVANKVQIEALLKLLVDGLANVLQAALAAADEDIEKADAKKTV